MKTIFNKLDKKSNLLVLLALFMLFNLILNYLMPKGLALDIRFAYTANEAFAALSAMGPEVRDKYFLVIWTVDTPYMVVYFLLLTGLLRKLWKRKRVVVFPFAIAVLDFFENVMVSGLLKVFPTESQTLGFFASFFTTTKWLFAGICALILVVGVVRNYVLKNQPDLNLNR